VEVRLPIGAESFVPNRGLLPEDFPYNKDRVLGVYGLEARVEIRNSVLPRSCQINVRNRTHAAQRRICEGGLTVIYQTFGNFRDAPGARIYKFST
jgi:hypothetical protein